MAPSPSAAANRVVVALLDGRRLKGFVYNFAMGCIDLNVFPSPNADRKVAATLVEVAACKAIFFVKSHEGSKEGRAAEREASANPKKRAPRGTKIRIIFSDGEEMVACTESYSPNRQGFWIYPLDARSNNLRVFIVNANVKQVLTLKPMDTSHTAKPDQERIARLTPPGSPAVAAEAFSLDLKCEAVLRVLTGETPADLGKEYGIPPPVVSFWTQTFLQAGRVALGSEMPTGGKATETLVAELRTRIRDLESELKKMKEAEPKRR